MERKLIAIAVATGLGLPMAADAVEGSASGHVNAAIVKVDDGDATLQSGNGSETRFRFTGSEELESGMTVGVTLELGAGGGTYGYGAGDNSDVRVRHANVSLSSVGGKVTIGQQNTPADASSYADVGSTFIAGATNWCSYGIGGGAACVNNESARKQAVRYDAPAIGPVSLGAGFGNDDVWDVAAQLSGSAGDAGYNLRVGYNGTEGNEDLIVGGSVTVGSTGIAASWTSGEYMDDNEMVQDNESMYVKLDQTYGDGSVAVYYKRGEDAMGEGDLWGVGVAHSLGGGATAYAGYRRVENDGADEVDGLLAGVRVTF